MSFHNLGLSRNGASPMAFNQIRFQHGMSNPEFLRSFGTEAQCAEAVKQARCRDGFRVLAAQAPIRHASGGLAS